MYKRTNILIYSYLCDIYVICVIFLKLASITRIVRQHITASCKIGLF